MTATCPTLARAAVFAGSFCATGCYLSHERLDETVPPSACVDDEATVALTPANWAPGACQRIEVLVEPDAICHVPPETSGRTGETTAYPEEWRRVRFVNTTDRAASAGVAVFAESCPRPGFECWAFYSTETACGCAAGGGAAGGSPVMGPRAGFEVAAHAEREYVVTGPTARYVLTLCDGFTE